MGLGTIRRRNGRPETSRIETLYPSTGPMFPHRGGKDFSAPVMNKQAEAEWNYLLDCEAYLQAEPAKFAACGVV